VIARRAFVALVVLGAACKAPGREIRGAPPAPDPIGARPAPLTRRTGATFMDMRDLYRLARQTASGTVPDEWRQSLPVPVRRDGLSVVFFFLPQQARPGEPNLLGAPDYRSRLRASDGRLLSLESVEPSSLPGSPSPNDVIGTLAMPPGMTAAEFLQQQQELFAAYDVLLPAFSRGETDLGQNGRDWARRFLGLFDLLSEPPLRPYYTQYGGEFFRWVAGVAGA
jgi:hypothetical protein